MPLFRAYAKINLGLLVLEKRTDGFHNIETVFHRINPFDEISFIPSPDIVIESSSPDAPSDERNICYKAATLIRDHLQIHDGVKITITKNIPVGGGLGGGSSDAATVLLHLPAFWKQAVAPETLNTFALQLGSDVPFFLGKSSAHATGRGEELSYFDLDVPYSIVLCHPGIHVSTVWAYRHIRPNRRSLNLRQAVEEGMKSPSTLGNLKNDFESGVFKEHPTIKEVKEMMLQSGAVFASMSGSGSSVYGLFDDETKAKKAEAALRERHLKTWLTNPHFRPEFG